MNITDFQNWLKSRKYPCDEITLSKFHLFYELLLTWNAKFNLTSLTSFEDVYEKHFIDSLLFPLSEQQATSTILDLGTGAGFPGIPLKIIYPNLKLYLLESNGKKVTFLQNAVEKLALNNVTVIHARAEEYISTSREAFNLVVSRAVAPLNILLELALPFVAINGEFWAYKGKNMTGELTLSSRAFEKLNANLKSSFETLLPFRKEERNLLIVIKKGTTPTNYPRAYKDIKNNPL